jgi:HEAT repeat protein
VCAKLEEAVLSSSDYETRANAALALSYVRDPVAAPHLGEVLKKGGVLRGVAIHGLVRVGSPEAVEILASNLNTRDQELKAQIKAALQEIRSGVHPQIMD